MKTFKVNYLAPNTKHKTLLNGRCPCFIHQVATYHCDTEQEAIAKFNRYHANKNHQFQFIWEETDIDRLRMYLTKKLMPR